MKRLCPRCGKEVDNDHVIDNFCIDCYLEVKKPISIPEIQLTVCTKCGKIKYQTKWYSEIENLEQAISKHIKIQEFKQPKVSTKLNIDWDKNEFFATVTIKTIINDKFKTITKQVPVIMNKDTCLVCSRISGSYYTAILQVRFDSKKLKSYIEDKIFKEIESIIKNINSKSNKASASIHIIKNIKQKTGFDLYFDNLKLTYGLLQHLAKHRSAGRTETSKTLVGVDKTGQRMYRTTFCIHFEEKE